MHPSDVFIPGLATGIGSLPHMDPVAAAEAVFAAFSGLPAVPQLPQRSPREGMCAQVARFIPGVAVAPTGELVRAPGADGTDALDAESWAGLIGFLEVGTTRGIVPERIKVQCAGPITMAMTLSRIGFSAPEAMILASTGVRRCIQALETSLRHVFPDSALVVLLDEPGLASWSDDDGFTDRESATDLLSGALATVTGVSGVHVCGNGDRRLALDAGPDVLSIEVRSDVLDDVSVLGRFLDNDGWIVWGAVPTDRPIGEAPEPLWRALVSNWCVCTQSGFDPVRVRAQAIISPACGLAMHRVPQAEHAMALAGALAARVHEQAAAARLTLGA
ncbi:MAG: hypothetical protein ACOYN3_06005 [Acidimicrobiia bacterium]